MGAVADKGVGKPRNDMKVKVKTGSKRSLKVDVGGLNKAALLGLLPGGVSMAM